jgi:hypothetical protein
VAPDHLAVASLMSVELQAGDIGDNRLKPGFALGERQARRVAAIEMQKVEGVKDKMRAARAPSVAACVSAKLGKPSSPMPHKSPSR